MPFRGQADDYLGKNQRMCLDIRLFKKYYLKQYYDTFCDMIYMRQKDYWKFVFMMQAE